MTPLIISADDYAYSDSIDHGILALIRQRRLTATSCLVMSPRWPQAAKRLDSEIRNHADIGLHLDFTEFGETARYRLPVLIARAVSRSLSKDAVRASIKMQLDHFEDATGTAPDYIDGHQHVHQLPLIRDELLDILHQRYSDRLPWIRIANPPWRDGFKAGIIGLLGASALANNTRKTGVRHSKTLLGVYAFNLDAVSYREKLISWFDAARSDAGDGGCVLMCHPAMAPDSAPDQINDPIHAARLHEYQVFSSADFADLLKQHDIQLGRGSILSTD